MKSAKWCFGVPVLCLFLLVGFIYGPFQWYTVHARDAAVQRLRSFAEAHSKDLERKSPEPTTPAIANLQGTDYYATLRKTYDDINRLSDEDKAGWDVSLAFMSKERKLSPDEYALVEKYLEKATTIVAGIRTLSETRRPPLDTHDPKYFENVTHFSVAYMFIRSLLATDALFKLERNKTAESLNDVSAMIAFADSLSTEPDRRIQHFRYGFGNTVFCVVQNIVSSGKFSLQDVNSLTALLPHDYARPIYAQALTNEALGMINNAEDRRKAGTNGVDVSKALQSGFVAGRMGSGRPGPSTAELKAMSLGVKIYYSPLGRPWQNLDEKAYVDCILNVIDVARLPYYKAVPDTYALARLNHSGIGPVFDVFGTTYLSEQATFESKMDCIRMSLLLEQYRMQHSKYPNTLDAIAPELGGSLLLDPYSGKSYIYRPKGESFLLYSVGYNQKDDQGAKEGWNDGDIVWHGGKRQN